MSRNIHKEEEDVSTDVHKLQQLLLALGRRRSLRDPIAATCEQLQFTPPQVHALLWLGQDGALTMGELARRLGVTEKTVTGVVDRLEREGHLMRERSAADRRVVRCRLTPDGQATWQKLERFTLQGMGQLLSILDTSDRKALFRILEKLLRRIDSQAGAAPSSRERSA
ncbi:MarR family winged helix-turn-helix transcriptional regulator [Pyxidicoccus sp. MSG2]|uniref:MarR family winged helix-turn-helix transcriptional regulator n=1 Tax=Pyxidicoccus sp. MSG2 TaxID=2996790 RepID=UPI00227044D7|nr:MarR family transcriptional regulator [Pyxidicoccus sp. MSG2]MCY1019536.1 MarR family transcriptional regulator [Pyxidicoccus sp. MSG2]